MTLRLIAVLAVLLWAGPAFAGADAWQSCASVHEGGVDFAPGARFLSPRGGHKSGCYDTDGTADSVVLNVGSCDHVDVWIFNMTDGTTADVAAQFMICPSIAGTNCIVAENVTLDGDPATDTESIQGIGADYGYVNMTTNTNSDDVRIQVRCNNY